MRTMGPVGGLLMAPAVSLAFIGPLNAIGTDDSSTSSSTIIVGVSSYNNINIQQHLTHYLHTQDIERHG